VVILQWPSPVADKLTASAQTAYMARSETHIAERWPDATANDGID